MHRYKIVPVNGFTRTTVEGALDVGSSAAMLRQVAADARVRGHHLLLDLRDAEASGLSYSDVYRLVRMLSEHPRAFHNRIALLDTFREGFEVRAFLDEAAAVLWLEATEPVA